MRELTRKRGNSSSPAIIWYRSRIDLPLRFPPRRRPLSTPASSKSYISFLSRSFHLLVHTRPVGNSQSAVGQSSFPLFSIFSTRGFPFPPGFPSELPQVECGYRIWHIPLCLSNSFRIELIRTNPRSQCAWTRERGPSFDR
jgi:hypothetical protein